MTEVAIIIPCFNEARRLKVDYLSQIASIPGVRLLLVDDGSQDQTLERLLEAASFIGGDSVKVLALDRNGGKGEAVRRGFEALGPSSNLTWVGFLDADGAITKQDVERIIQIAIGSQDLDMIWSSRVALAGHNIRRSTSRHYVARTFATFIGLFYPALPYDTQSGFKLFKASALIFEVCKERFRTRWLFEIEILIRWAATVNKSPRLWEQPLLSWEDVEGSKVTNPKEVIRLLGEVITVINLARFANSKRREI